MKVCNNCGKWVADGASQCPACGASMPPIGMMQYGQQGAPGRPQGQYGTQVPTFGQPGGTYNARGMSGQPQGQFGPQGMPGQPHGQYGQQGMPGQPQGQAPHNPYGAQGPAGGQPQYVQQTPQGQPAYGQALQGQYAPQGNANRPNGQSLPRYGQAQQGQSRWKPGTTPGDYGQDSAYIKPSTEPVVPPPEKSNKAMIIGIISGVTALIAALVLMMLFLWPGFLRDRKEKITESSQITTESGTVTGRTEQQSQDTEWKTEATEQQTESRTDTTERDTEDGTTEQTTVADGTPDFEKYQMDCSCMLNVEYSFRTCTSQTPVQYANAKVTFTEYSKEKVGQDTIEFGRQNGIDLTGYEKKVLKYRVDFDDEVFETYGYDYIWEVNDYYDVDLLDDTFVRMTDTTGASFYKIRFRIDGKETDGYFWTTVEKLTKDGHVSVEEAFYVFVPSGYDGIVIGPGNRMVSGDHIYDFYKVEDFCFFRLD